jgi:hypothetical protein
VCVPMCVCAFGSPLFLPLTFGLCVFLGTKSTHKISRADAYRPALSGCTRRHTNNSRRTAFVCVRRQPALGRCSFAARRGAGRCGRAPPSPGRAAGGGREQRVNLGWLASEGEQSGGQEENFANTKGAADAPATNAWTVHAPLTMPQKRAREDGDEVDVTELKDYLKAEEAKLREGSKEVLNEELIKRIKAVKALDARVRHTRLTPFTSRPQTGPLLTSASLTLDRSPRRPRMPLLWSLASRRSAVPRSRPAFASACGWSRG